MTLVQRATMQRRGYGWARLLGDLSGGVIAALIALPHGLAMASLMGLPPVLGVFTSILTAPVIAALGRNPVLIGGPVSATAPFIAMAAREQGVGGAAKISIAASVIMMGFCVIRLGRLIARMPHAVVAGFSCGIGAMMLISQLYIILGVERAASQNEGSAIAQLAAVLNGIGGMRPLPLLLGVSVIAAAAAASKWWPRAPAPLLGILFALVIARAGGIQENEVGSLPAALPPLAGFSWSPNDVFTVLPSAFGLAFVASANLLITARVVEHFRGKRGCPNMSNADAELGAYGIANIFGGIFGAPLSVGSPARSLAVIRCGGSTRLANVLHALILGAILWLGAGILSHIPMPALAGVNAWIGLSLLDPSAWRRLPNMSRTDASAFLATAGLVVAVNAAVAIAIGCSMLCPALRRAPCAKTTTGVRKRLWNQAAHRLCFKVRLKIHWLICRHPPRRIILKALS